MERDWKAEFAAIRKQKPVAQGEIDTARAQGRLPELLVSNVKEYAIFMLDPDGIILTWNLGAHRIKQYEAHEVIGKHYRMLYTPSDVAAGRPEKNLTDTLRYGQTEDLGWRMKKDGSWFWADALITAVYNDAGQLLGFAKVIRDLTEANKSEEQARELEVAKRTTVMKDQFLSLISHELRTPLTAIQGYAELIEDGSAGPMNEQQIKYLGSIQKGADALTRLVNDLIEMSSIHAGNLRLAPTVMSFSEVVQGVVYAVQPQAQAKHLWVANHVSSDLPELIADPQRVGQILIHVIDNAVKFTPHNGRIDIWASVENGLLHCEVSDTGAGIAPEALERLFKDFNQVDMSSTRAEGGLGIGLSLSKKLVEAHGGQIGVMSKLGKGTTFWFNLPLRPAPSAQPLALEHEGAERQHRGRQHAGDA